MRSHPSPRKHGDDVDDEDESEDEGDEGDIQHNITQLLFLFCHLYFHLEARWASPCY